MTGDRRSSGFAGLDLDDVDDRPAAPRRSRHEIDAKSTTPSREPAPVPEGRDQMNLSLKISDKARYSALCERAGLSKAKMLVVLMDAYERR
ncbi:MAG: hypothetical protein ACR2RE_06320 [Geminicoccaceae bacterium]